MPELGGMPGFRLRQSRFHFRGPGFRSYESLKEIEFDCGRIRSFLSKPRFNVFKMPFCLPT